MNDRGRRRLGVLWLAVAVAGCRGGPSSDASDGGARPAVPVRVGTVTREPAPVELRATGRVDPLETVGVKAQVGGVLTRVHVNEGDEVRTGELLLTIDPRPYEAAVLQAEAALARDEAQAAQARHDAARYATLVTKGYVTRQQYTQSLSTATALEAGVRADRAGLEVARLNLSYCLIRSPIDGRMGRLALRQGNLVKANPDIPLVTVNQIRPIAVSFAVPASELPRIQENFATGPMSVLARPPGAARGTRGQLTLIDNAVDQLTGTIGLRATFLNEDEALWPGEPVDVVFTPAVQQGALLVAAAALQQGQAGTYAWVVKQDRTVESRPVVVDRAVAERVVVARGLEAGEQVVIDGALGLVAGATVEVHADTSGKAAPDRSPRGRPGSR